MARVVHDFTRPDRFIAGTVGMPGERTFYLQARDGARTLSVALEKQQVTLLADRIDVLLDHVAVARPDLEIRPRDDNAAVDTAPLDLPLTEEFRVGALGLGWDTDVDCVVIEAHAQGADDTDVPDVGEEPAPGQDAPDVLRVRIAPDAARAFAVRARRIVAAGRPPCPLCALPLDPTGHICPRANGYRR